MFDRVLNTPLVIKDFYCKLQSTYFAEHLLVAACIQKQPYGSVLMKMCSYKYAANLQENKRVFSCKFAAYL